jgi:putative hydrolase of the HAD superfamily
MSIKIKILSFDLDGTIITKKFVDTVWLEGIPKLYAAKNSISIEDAKRYILSEYNKIGDSRIEWYDIRYWFKKFNLGNNWQKLLESYKNEIELYPEVVPVLENLSKKCKLILSSNAKREFIDIELRESKIGKYFSQVFSSTSDFNIVKKTGEFYERICNILRIEPSEMIHIGDHKEFDYIIPRKLGVKPFYLDREGKEKGDFVVKDLNDFQNKISKFLE